MDNFKLGLMSSIIQFLRAEFEANYLDAENNEGLEVVIHCLENIYDVSSVQGVPSILEIYNSYLSNSVLAKRDATEEEKAEGERLKNEGNAAMSAGKYAEAMVLYTRAINCNPKNAVYYCNRAAAKSKLNDHLSAINDCKLALELDPTYSKAYGRLGLAYCGLESYVSALENYKKAYDLEPDNEGYRRNFELAQQKVADLCCCTIDERNQSTSTLTNQGATAASTSSADPANPLGAGFDLNSLLGNPQLINFATQMLSDPEMMNMMSQMISHEGGMQVVLQAGQNLARHMQSENPTFFNQLRQSLANQGENTHQQENGSNQGGPSGDHNPADHNPGDPSGDGP